MLFRSDFEPRPKDDSIIQVPIMVSSLINPLTKSWCENRLMELFDDESIEAIKRIQIPIRPRQDSLMWIKGHKGCFSVKSAYRLCQDQPWSTSIMLKKLAGYLESKNSREVKNVFTENWSPCVAYK